ncbi:MAG TPA: MBL fold metallo-hydrolase [Novosphingobium sp.]
MSLPTLTIHGAGLTVTGSCVEFAFDGRRLLIDCGLFQGSRSLEALNREPFAFDPRQIDGVLVTHAHIDHGGLLPRLVAEGYDGPIWCTDATLDLLGVMLTDAARIREQDVERRNRRADRADEPPVEPTYTARDAELILELVQTVELKKAFAPCPGVEARFWDAGHILGAASIELSAGGVRTILSSDLDPDNKSFHAPPVGPQGFESPYGDR